MSPFSPLRGGVSMERVDKPGVEPCAPAFDFYEIVAVNGDQPEYADIRGERGFIAGRAVDDSGSWGYAVYIYNKRECWDVYEKALETTGKFDEQERNRAK